MVRRLQILRTYDVSSSYRICPPIPDNVLGVASKHSQGTSFIASMIIDIIQLLVMHNSQRIDYLANNSGDTLVDDDLDYAMSHEDNAQYEVLDNDYRLSDEAILFPEPHEFFLQFDSTFDNANVDSEHIKDDNDSDFYRDDIGSNKA